MTNTFNPIIEEGYVPTDEVGVLGTRKVRPKNPEFKPVPMTAVVIHRPRADAVGVREEDFEVLGEHQSASAVQMDASSRFFRIDLGERVIEWQISARSQNPEYAFVVNLVTVVAVTDPKRIAVLGVRDARVPLRPVMLEMVRSAAGGYGIDDGHNAAREVETRLRDHALECGIAIRTAFAIVEPDAWSAERVKQGRADEEKRLVQDHENHLRQLKHDHSELVDAQKNQHELALKKQSADFKIQLDQAELDFQTELQKLKGPHQRELAELKAAAELEKVKQQAAVDAEREQHRKARQDAEEQSQEQQRKHEKELAESLAAQEANLAKIQREIDGARDSAEAEAAHQRHQRELAEAADLNRQIAGDPSKMMGFLLALGDTDSVRAAFKMLEERQKVAWDRFKDLQKLDVLPEEELRALASSLMRDPAGGAFGLGAETEGGGTAE